MKKFEIRYTREAEDQLLRLEKDKSKRGLYKAVGKTLGLMQMNLRHPSLNTHEYVSLSRERGIKSLNHMLKITLQELTVCSGITVHKKMKLRLSL